MSTAQTASTAASAVMKTYGRADLAFVRGEGSWLITEDGTRYLDCASGIAVNTLGHSHPALVAALKAALVMELLMNLVMKQLMAAYRLMTFTLRSCTFLV